MRRIFPGAFFVMLVWAVAVLALAATDISTPKIQPRDLLLRAKVAAAAISRPDGKHAAFLEIASAQSRARDRAGAIETLRAGLPNALLFDVNVAYEALGEIADGLVRLGDIDGALEIADLVPREYFQADVAARILAGEVEAADIASALQIARKIRIARLRAVVLALAATAQAEKGYRADGRKTLGEALQVAAQLSQDWERSEALQAIAAAQAAAGEVQAALQTAAAIRDPVRKEDALRGIAMTQARLKDIPGALRTADSIQDARRKVSALNDIGTVQARRGDIQASLQTAATIPKDHSRGTILREIAAAQARAGEVKRALETASEIREDFVKAEALREIAAIQVTAGDIQGAFRTVAMIQSVANIGKTGTARALREMAAAQAQKGDVAGALRTAASISQDDEHMQRWAFRDIAVAQAVSGDIQGGLKTVAMIQDAEFEHLLRGSAARWVIAAQARRGAVRDAIKWAENQAPPALKAFGLLGVAEGMMERQGAGKPRDYICRKALAGDWASPFIIR